MSKYIKPSDNLYIYYFEGIVDPKGILFVGIQHFLGNWIEENSSFLFFSSPADTLIQTILSNNNHAKFMERYEMTYEQWHGDKIKPYTIGNILISPPWEKPVQNNPDQKQLILDPGVVFGTGKHTTTEECFSMLKRLMEHSNRVLTIMDIGSGTGLLSVGAALLGAEKVLACDFNFLAAKTTLNNARLNSFEEKILVSQDRGEEFINLNAHVVVANIHYDIMKDLIEQKGFLNKQWFILSGLLRTQAKKVLNALAQKPVQIIEHTCPDGIWNTIFGQCID